MGTETNNRYLTKTLFVKALECPTKLYYHGKDKEYAVIEDDAFTQALQEGGFQVGELARCYYPGGTQIEVRGHDEAVRQTNELLKQKNAIIYEAAVRFDKFFIRVPIPLKSATCSKAIRPPCRSLATLVFLITSYLPILSQGFFSFCYLKNKTALILRDLRIKTALLYGSLIWSISN